MVNINPCGDPPFPNPLKYVYMYIKIQICIKSCIEILQLQLYADIHNLTYVKVYPVDNAYFDIILRLTRPATIKLRFIYRI
jgi:hypothetical protein